MRSIIDQAIAAGKFSEQRRGYYERLYASDPAGTTRLIASLETVRDPGASSAPEGPSAPYTFFDERWTTREFQDTMATKDGTRPALGAYPIPLADPSKVTPLDGFTLRKTNRITVGD